MSNSVCSFSGHRQIYRIHSDILPKCLSELIDTLIEAGVVRFCSGGATGFDLLAAELVLKKRNEGKHVSLSMILPCRDQALFWPAELREQYARILSGANEVEYITDKYNQFCMHQRNRRLVDEADILLCYLMHEASGTAYTKNYAVQKKKHIINIADLL